MSIIAGVPGTWQIIIVLALFLLFFGTNRLPNMARSLGRSFTEFKKGLRGEDDEEKKKVGTGGDGDDKKDAEAKEKEEAK